MQGRTSVNCCLWRLQNYSNLLEELKKVQFTIKEVQKMPKGKQDPCEMEHSKEWKNSVCEGLQLWRDRKRKLDKVSLELIEKPDALPAIAVCNGDSQSTGSKLDSDEESGNNTTVLV